MNTVIGAVLGLVLAAGVGYPQETPAGKAPAEPKKCDLSKVENRAYCLRCHEFPATADIEKGACKKCKSKVEQVSTCVKTAFPCKMHGDKEVLHSKRCCKPEVKTCCVETTLLSRIEFWCDACGQRGPTEKDVVHLREKCEGKVAKTCELSGTFPHGGEEYRAGETPK